MDSMRFKVSFSVDHDFKSDKFVKLRLKLCHDGLNPNKTFFHKEDLEARKDTLANSPMLAHIFEGDDGKPTIGAHDMIIEQDAFDEDKARLIYLERPVGLIPEQNNFEIVQGEDGLNYVFVDGYIWKDYSNYLLDILESYDDIKISMEVDILSYKYDKAKDYYEITNFIYRGITFLNEKYETGMKNARAKFETFAQKEDMMTEIKTIMQELSTALTQYNSTTKGEESEMNTERIDEILTEYKLTKDAINFEITDDMSEEDFRQALDKFVSETSDAAETAEVAEDAESTETDAAESEDKTEDETPAEDTTDSEQDESTETEAYKANYILASDKLDMIKGIMPDEFRTDEDGRCVSCAYYYIMDYDDTYGYFVKYAWDISNGDKKSYVRQGYKIEGNTITAVGTSEEVFQSWLTAEELNELSKMKANYSELSTEVEALKEYKANIEKTTRDAEVKNVFEMFDAELSAVDEYIALKEKCADMSVDAIKTECYALVGMKKFSANKATTKENKLIGFSLDNPFENTSKGTDNKYDDIFEKYNN